MEQPQPDQQPAVLDRLERLTVPLVSDCLDSLGLRDQVMQPHIRPLDRADRIAGRAHTAEVVTVDRVPEDRSQWYRREIEAIDTLRPGDVLVASTNPESFWGELLSTAAASRGARGVVGDCHTRDVPQILELGFPCFFAGIYATDSLGRADVAEIGGTIECGGVVVHEGDYLLADYDGVVVIPAAQLEETLTRAENKRRQESGVREALQSGASVREVFDRFGIL